MKKIKLIAGALCALFCLGILAGCGSADPGKKLIVATHATFPPYEFYRDGKAVGIDIDIMQAVCTRLGYEMEIADMEFGSIITAVQSGKADVGAAAITMTEDRAKSVNFTQSYATGIQSVLVQNNSSIGSIDDLRGETVKIGVQQDTTGDIYATKDFGEDHIIRFNKGADAVQALVTGKCSAVIIDSGPAETFASMNESLKVLPAAYEEEDYSFMISYDNPELHQAVNDALSDMLEDGSLQEIIDRYITAE